MDSPTFMDGTGVTAYKPTGEAIYITPAEEAELATRPEKLAKLCSEMAASSYWHESGDCCQISAGHVAVLDPKTNIVHLKSAALSPLHRERALVLTEEISHHLQSLAQAQGGNPFVSRQMAVPNFATVVGDRIRLHVLQNHPHFMNWLVRSAAVQNELANAVARFKTKHPAPDGTVSAADHTIFSAIPGQLTVLTHMMETGEVSTPEGKAFSAQLSRDTERFMSAFPPLTAPVIDFVVGRELREADAYYLLQDLYGSQVIDVAWRNRYVGRKLADGVLGRQ